MTDDAFDALAAPPRLNLGCGWDIREGFLNVDLHAFHNPDLVADVTQLEMLPAEHYEEIVAQDVLEHLPRQSTQQVLRRWCELLAPGGRIELRVPSVIDLVELIRRPEHQTVEQQERFIQCLFGTQAYTEDCHYTTFTELLLRHYLTSADLRVDSWSVRDGWLFEVTAVKVPRLAELAEQSEASSAEASAAEAPAAEAPAAAKPVRRWSRLRRRA